MLEGKRSVNLGEREYWGEKTCLVTDRLLQQWVARWLAPSPGLTGGGMMDKSSLDNLHVCQSWGGIE
jgi:hypothetical protein